MSDFTTDADVLMSAASSLTGVAELAETKADEFESSTHIPAAAYGGTSVLPPIAAAWNFSGRLADLVEGPYNTARSYMVATLSRTAVVLRLNADAMTSAARSYVLQDLHAAEDITKSGK